MKTAPNIDLSMSTIKKQLSSVVKIKLEETNDYNLIKLRESIDKCIKIVEE